MDLHDEMLLGKVVHEWVEHELPSERGLPERAAAVASSAYHTGATIGEACEEAQALVGSWCRHPAHRVAKGLGHSRLAS